MAMTTIGWTVLCSFGRIQLGRLEMRMKRGVAILLLAGLAAACGATDPKQRIAEGDRYMAEKKYSEAIIEYRGAVRADSNSGEVRAKLAEAYIAAGDGRNALREMVRAADQMPANDDVQLRAGALLLLARQFAEARQRAVKVLERDSNNARALLLLGNAFAGLNDINGAVEQVERALDDDPGLMLAYSNLGALQLAKGDREAAELTFKRAVSVAPESVDPRLTLANFFWAVGQQADAEREIQAALALDPTSASANRAMAALYFTQNKPREAERYLKAYADASGSAEARLVLADLYLRTARPTEATDILSAVAKEPSGVEPATIRLALLDYAQGRRTDAHAKLDTLLKGQVRPLPMQGKITLLLRDGKAAEALKVSDT